MDLSKIDCPQFVSFLSDNFQDTYVSQDECGTPSQSLKHSQSGLFTRVEKYGDENTNSEYSLVLEASLTDPDESHATFNSTMRSPLTGLDSLENSIESFPVQKVFHFSAPNNGRQNKPRNVTRVREFNLTKGVKKEKENYLPLAEQVATFHRKTPSRFHTTGPKKYEPVERWVPPVVNPRSPELQALKRRRINTAVSREQQEEKEIEEMKNYKFRAKPLNPKILKKPDSPKKKNRPVTKPEGFKLKTAERAAEHSLMEEDEKYEFHAMPAPKNIFNGPTGLKEKLTLPTTCPKSPAFALKEREQKWKTKNKSDCPLNDAKVFHANPAPLSNSPFVVKHDTKATTVQPFSFDKKDQERYALKKRKIEEEIKTQCEVPPFKAQALPYVESRLSCTPRRNRCTKNDNTVNTPVVFKAQPATVLKKLPFVPKKVSTEVPDFKEFHFETEKRVQEWNKIKEQQHAKEMEKEQIILKQKTLEEEKERQEIKRLRSETVHKANPMKTFKSFEVKHSERPLTIPKSPNFATKKRLDKRNS